MYILEKRKLKNANLNFCSVKVTVKKTKRQATNLDKILEKHISEKQIVSTVQKILKTEQ